MGHAVVVGGGIGGLGAAVGLHRIGWDVTVLERADGFTEVGAGISLWPNALRCLDVLGVDLREHLRSQHDGGLRDRDGKRITGWDAKAFERHHGLPLAAIHRADLIDGLKNALPTSSLHAGAEVTEAREDGLVRFTGGEIQADLVVAADGIRSPIRHALAPHHPEPAYSGTTAFRGIAHRTADLTTGWDRGTEIGVVPLTGDQAYWWIGYVTEPGIRYEDPKAHLLERFGDWHDPIPALIEATGDVLHHDIYHLGTPLPRYTKGKIALLGDAAHAMPPFLGQGGCQALEDAVVLAAALSTSDVQTALKSYDAQRRPRSQMVAKKSVQAGNIGPQLRNPLAVAIRKALIKRIPAKAIARAGARISGWQPPSLARPARPRTP